MMLNVSKYLNNDPGQAFRDLKLNKILLRRARIIVFVMIALCFHYKTQNIILFPLEEHVQIMLHLKKYMCEERCKNFQINRRKRENS